MGISVKFVVEPSRVAGEGVCYEFYGGSSVGTENNVVFSWIGVEEIENSETSGVYGFGGEFRGRVVGVRISVEIFPKV